MNARSMSSTEAKPSSAKNIASFLIARHRRLNTNPWTSPWMRTEANPRLLPNRRASSRCSSRVCPQVIVSTYGRSQGWFKKCMFSTRSGFSSPPANRELWIDELLVAIGTVGGQIRSNSEKTCCLISRSSVTVSITNCVPATASPAAGW